MRTKATVFFRKPGSRIEHITVDLQVTLCGIEAYGGAKYTAAEAASGGHGKVRPVCRNCSANV